MKLCDNYFLQNKPTFLYGAVKKEQFIKNKIPEIAFIGKSNVGKSSLINSITNSKIAKTSKTPGRTKELNFFNINNKFNIVDMPGYGFALTTEKEREKWHNFIYEYLIFSKNLKRLFLLIDTRRGIKANDFKFMQILDELQINYQIILTKVDTCKQADIENVITGVTNELSNHKTLEKNILFSSSSKNINISEIRDTIFSLINK